MNKSDLVDKISDKADLTKTKTSEALNATLDAIQAALENEERVTLVGFGTFDVRERAARTGVNPQTGEKMQIPAMKTVHFKTGKNLKEAVRNS